MKRVVYWVHQESGCAGMDLVPDGEPWVVTDPCVEPCDRTAYERWCHEFGQIPEDEPWYARQEFEERAFKQRFLCSIERTGLGGPLEFMPKDCPTKAEFIERDERGHYKDSTLAAMWWAWLQRRHFDDEL